MSDWHPWQALPQLPSAVLFTPALLDELLDGGQAFRWRALPDATFEGQWSSHHVRVRPAADDASLLFSAPLHADRAATAAALHAYLAGPAADTDALPWRSDPHLAACLAAFPGLGILRQPFGETLLGFVCSATKQIVQIKQMMELLSERHGNLLPHGRHSLPTWEKLATVSELELRACSLGFRARHVAGIATFLAQHPGWLDAAERAPYPEAKVLLLSLPGVGEKMPIACSSSAPDAWKHFPWTPG